jgi:leucyl aminopeptidase
MTHTSYSFQTFDPGFTEDTPAAQCTPIYLLSADSITFEDESFEAISLRAKNWIKACNFTAASGATLLVPDDEGLLSCIVLGLGTDNISDQDPLIVGSLPQALPEGDYRILYGEDTRRDRSRDALAWALGCYRFDRYKKMANALPKLWLDQDVSNPEEVLALARATAFGRDLISTPPNDMGPEQIADAAQSLAAAHDAPCRVIIGDDLLSENFPMVHAVGRASEQAPRLVDFSWGDDSHPKVTLVGKGVAFDSGGLDIKSAAGMLLMKKDMGGAANVLALASAIMATKLPIRLRVIIPCVENAISGSAFRPGDVLTSRSGRTVEIGNTDAEGRLILADALTLAGEEEPDLIVDMATLTGAARVALGTDIPGLFSNDDGFAAGLQATSLTQADPLWHMPLWQPYKKSLDSKIADINHISSGGYGGAITAALFLSTFVETETKWAHIDLMAYNLAARPGKPVGGETQGMRALFQHLKQLYANDQ